VRLIDEGIADVPLDLEADLIGLTVITGTARRAYELADHFRARGITVVLGGPHVTLIPDDAAPHADAMVVGYAEDTWPQLLRDFARAIRPRYTQAPDLDRSAGAPSRGATCCRASASSPTTSSRRRAAACTAATSASCPPPGGASRTRSRWHEVIADIRQHGARKLIFVDLNLIADRGYAVELFTALIPLRLQWYGLSTVLLADDDELLAWRPQRLQGLLMGLESISKPTSGQPQGLQLPRALRARGRAPARPRHRAAGVLCLRPRRGHPGRLPQTAEFAVAGGIDLPRFAVVTPFPNTPLYRRLDAEGRILTRDWELYDAQHVVFQPAHEVQELQLRASKRPGNTPTAFLHLRRLRHSPAPWPVRSAPTSATASTPTTFAGSTTATGSSGVRRQRTPFAPGRGTVAARVMMR
jgi:hypothetical protein